MNSSNQQIDRNQRLNKTATVISMMMLIAALHVFRVGQYLSGRLYSAYYSYFSDMALPFGMYFLLCLNELSFRFLRRWYVKALLVFGVAAFAEIMQGFGIPLLGVTFDPLDFLMYGLGVLAAAFLDTQVLARWLPFWSLEGARGE